MGLPKGKRIGRSMKSTKEMLELEEALGHFMPTALDRQASPFGEASRPNTAQHKTEHVMPCPQHHRLDGSPNVFTSSGSLLSTE